MKNNPVKTYAVSHLVVYGAVAYLAIAYCIFVGKLAGFNFPTIRPEGSFGASIFIFVPDIL